jgi:hypothetical protein
MNRNTLRRDFTELNHGFLGLASSGLEVGLRPSVQERIASLGERGLHGLAGLPFALFGLGFEEEGAWATLLSPCVRDLEPAYAAARAPAERFTLLALSTLRTHLRLVPEPASAWIGLPPPMRSQLVAVEISLLAPVAACAAPRLRARRVLREAVWLRLVEAAAGRDRRQLALLAAWGRQWSIRRSLGLNQVRAGSRAFRR